MGLQISLTICFTVLRKVISMFPFERKFPLTCTRIRSIVRYEIGEIVFFKSLLTSCFFLSTWMLVKNKIEQKDEKVSVIRFIIER